MVESVVDEVHSSCDGRTGGGDLHCIPYPLPILNNSMIYNIHNAAAIGNHIVIKLPLNVVISLLW
jgi:hypothetical protein